MEQKEIIETHWTEIKNAIRGQWIKLTDEDLEKRKKSQEDLMELIESEYPGEKNHELFNTLINFFDFNEEAITPPNEEFYEHHQTAPRSSELSEFQDDASDIKTRGPERKKFEDKIKSDKSVR